MGLFDLRYDWSNSCFNIGNDCIEIWAHDNEVLTNHILKTRVIFEELLNEEIIHNFFNYFSDKGYLEIEYNDFLSFLTKLVEFHDIGKISFNFKLNRVKNLAISEKLDKCGLNEFVEQIDADHSFSSSLLYANYLINDLEIKNSSLKNNIPLLLLPYVIYGHHTSIKDILYESGFSYDTKSKETCHLFSFFLFGKEPNNKRTFNELQDYLFDFLRNNLDPELSFFYSYIYSLLVTSDIIASSYADKSIESVKKYSTKWNNRIIVSLQNSMKQKFHELDYNKKCKEISIGDTVSDNKIHSLIDINDLRTEMLKESSLNLIESLKSNQDSRIFYLNMPTGGGKTNTSMKLALDILENTNINRIIYAMPFINIIDQNYDIIKDNFGLSEDKGEIRKIYSASESIFPEISGDDKSEIIMKDSFFDYPVICTTFVSLFNTLIKNKKRYKYPLSSLTNSVIVLDEIQSLPLKNWTSLYYLINELSKNYNVYFIIMSATLPEFDELKLDKESKFEYNTIKLIDKPEKYFSHSVFDRTQITNKIKELNTSDLSEFSEYFENVINDNFQKGFTKGLFVLNTIKTSKFVFKCINRLKNKYGFEMDLLNSTIIPSEKQKIINKINPEKRKITHKTNQIDENSKYILISTQSIEAGVDVSFDFVVRDFTTLDSIEQVRGRCNRSGELNKRFKDLNIKGNVYITNIKRSKRFDYQYIYENEEIETKIKETMELFEKDVNYHYSDVLDYYNLISSDVNNIQDKREEGFVYNDRENNIKSWDTLNYSSILDNKYGIHIINNKENLNCSFFVEENIKITISDEIILNKTFEEMGLQEIAEIYDHNENDFIFTRKEIIYLKRYEREYGVKLIKENHIDGSNLIESYYNCYNKIKKDFNKKKIIQKEFSSILYKFIFQVTSNDLEDIISSQDLKKIGYFYVIPKDKIGEEEDKIYSLKNGFNFDFSKNQEFENFI